MKLIILPKNLAEELMNHNLSDIESKELEDILSELNEIDSDVKISNINLGSGADWVLLLAIFGSITSVIALGEKLDKGIEGWVNIGKRVNKIFKKTDKLYLDENGAKIIALTKISEKYHINTVTLMDSHIISLVDFSGLFLDRNPNDFTTKPFNIYNFTFDLNNERTICYSIKSNGEITEIIDIESDRLGVPF